MTSISIEPNDELNIVVLAGGISHERDVSLRSGRQLADALTRAGYKVTVKDSEPALISTLRESRPDVVVPMLHGASGEDGSLLDLLHAMRLPTVGSGGGPARRAWSKPIANSLVSDSAIAVPVSITLTRSLFGELGANGVITVAHELLGDNIIVKPGSGGSAQGVTFISEPGDLPRAVVDAFSYDSTVIIQQRIFGVEVAVTVINEGNGPVALPPVEIVTPDGIYDFDARYNAGMTTFYTPARLNTAALERVMAAAVSAHETLGLRDISRSDFIIDSDGVPWFLETNTVPGLTETSLAPLAITAADRTIGDVYSSLIRVAQERGA